MGLTKIISVTGKPGLYKVIGQSKAAFIVESLLDNKRFPITDTQNVSALNDIAIYTFEEEVPLRQVLKTISQKEQGKKALSHKESANKLLAYFAEILPNFDQERVYPSNIKKVVQWYNLLVDAKFDFSTITEETTEEA